MHIASTFAHLTGFLYGARRPTQIGGKNISVAYVENVLYEHPDLADVAVASGRASPSCSKPRKGNHHD
jgi:acyl-CoA synthetase (AMP-forming)/AMP-acid ligase II